MTFIDDKLVFQYSPEGIRNPVYAGKIRYANVIYDGTHQPIIPETVFNLAQTLHKTKEKHHKKMRHHTFAGLVRCGECGLMMTATHANKYKNGKLKRYFYYRCITTLKHEFLPYKTGQCGQA